MGKIVIGIGFGRKDVNTSSIREECANIGHMIFQAIGECGLSHIQVPMNLDPAQFYEVWVNRDDRENIISGGVRMCCKEVSSLDVGGKTVDHVVTRCRDLVSFVRPDGNHNFAPLMVNGRRFSEYASKKEALEDLLSAMRAAEQITSMAIYRHELEKRLGKAVSEVEDLRSENERLQEQLSEVAGTAIREKK